jgi:hypothetical protein
MRARDQRVQLGGTVAQQLVHLQQAIQQQQVRLQGQEQASKG